MTDHPRVPLARLWLRRSAAGREYMVGRMGGARVLIFPNSRKAAPDDFDFELVAVPAEDPGPARSRSPRPETLATLRPSPDVIDDSDPDLGPVRYLRRPERHGGAS